MIRDSLILFKVGKIMFIFKEINTQILYNIKQRDQCDITLLSIYYAFASPANLVEFIFYIK